MTELKPCECRGILEIREVYKAGLFYIKCIDCNNESDVYKTKEKAIAEWNKLMEKNNAVK